MVIQWSRMFDGDISHDQILIFIKSNGYSSDFRYLYLNLTDAQIRNEEQLKNLVVSNDGSRIVMLQDIAQIDIHNAKQYIKVNANGAESILIAIIQQPNANVVDVSKAMEAKIADLQKTFDLLIKNKDRREDGKCL